MLKKILSFIIVFLILFPLPVKANETFLDYPTSSVDHHKQYLSFKAMLDDPSLVSYWAWRKSTEQILAAPHPNLYLKIYDSSNVVVTNPYPLNSINLAAKLYYQSNPPTDVNLLRYTYSDIYWAESVWSNAFLEYPSFKNDVFNACKNQYSCHGGFAGFNSLKQSWLGLASMHSNVKSPNHYSGTLEAHEYVHTIQQSQMYKSPYNFNSLPIWLPEGQASYAQAASVYYYSFDLYIKEKNRIISSLNETYDWIQNFLTLSFDTSKNVSATFHQWRPYDVGFLVVEILTAYKGPTSVMNLYKEVAAGKTFEQAFYSQYQITWNEAYPLISKIIYFQIK